MKILLLVMIAGALANAAEPLFRWSFIGPQHGYRGYDVWLRVGGSWYAGEPATVDTTTDFVAVPGRTYNGTEALVMLSSGAIPSAIGRFRAYKPCSINGSRFKLVPTSTGGCSSSIVDFTDAGSGQLYIATPSPGPQTPFLKSIALPPGVTLVEITGNNGYPIVPSAGKYRGNKANSGFQLHLRIAPDAPLTPSSVSVTMEINGSDTPQTRPFQVKQLNYVSLARPTSFPPVPIKSTWESQMLTLGAKWCAKDTGALTNTPLAFGVETQVWYYDGAWVYRQLAAYTGDQQWLNCARSIGAAYRDYVLANGTVMGYRQFTDGLKGECQSCDGRYKVAIKQLADQGVFTLTGGVVRDDMIREVSYLLEGAINAAVAYGYTSPDMIPSTGTWPKIKSNMLSSAAMLMGMLDTQRGDDYIYQQTFMIGLAMRSLIRYWEYTGDPRVPVEIKETLDYIWNKLWLPASPPNTLIYNKSPRGPRCDYSCFPFGETTLINLTVPAFAWYWSITADDTYRQRGDTIWSHSFDKPVNFSGKVFSQNYRWSFDYVFWREGRAPLRP